MPNGPIDRVLALLQQYYRAYPQEKVHIHTDKNNYLAGDTIYFKAYVVHAGSNIISDTSKTLYVDLADNAGSDTISFCYPLINGVASGSFELPDSLATGKYTLRAYTGWMRNFSQDLFFRSDIAIAGTDSKPVQTSVDGKEHLYDIKFFPEGGQMVERQTSVIGFKVINAKGLGENVSGTILDDAGNSITTFSSAFAGMGRFNLKPMPGHNYKAVIKTGNGDVKRVQLPTAAAMGYTLALKQDKSDITVTVQYSGQQSPAFVSILAQAANKLISLKQVNLVDNIAVVKLPLQDFSDGIAQVTLFNHVAEPLAERLIFVKKKDQLRLSASQLDKTTRQITLEVTDELSNPVSGDFSVAITEPGVLIGSDNSPSILADLLLASDLKGYIEKPDRYFSDDDAATSLLLDNLMLTQGWRRFKWKDLIAEKNPKIIYPIEQVQTLAGSLRTKAGIPVSGGKVLLTSAGADVFSLNSVTDEHGHFKFDLPVLTGPQQFRLIGSTASGSTDVVMILDKPQPLSDEVTLKKLYATDLPRRPISANDTRLLKGRMPLSTNRRLKEVVVRSKKISLKEEALQASANLNGAGNADQVITYKDLGNCANLDQCLQGKLTGVIFKSVRDPVTKIEKRVPFSTSGMDKPMMIVLDGVPISGNEASINSIPTVDVQTIEVLRSGSKLVVYGMEAGGGVLLITTKRGGMDYNKVNESQKKIKVPGLQSIIYNGYHKSREFYTAKFEAADNHNRIIARTILWNPSIHTDEDGKATISLKPGINANKIDVIIEGISSDGKIGYLQQQQTLKN